MSGTLRALPPHPHPTGMKILTNFPSPAPSSPPLLPEGEGGEPWRTSRTPFHLGRGQRVREVGPHPHPFSRTLTPYPLPLMREGGRRRESTLFIEKGASRV